MEARRIIEQVRSAGACIQLEGEAITVEPMSAINDDLCTLIKNNRDLIYQELKSTLHTLVSLAIDKASSLYEQRVNKSEVLRVMGDTSGLADNSPAEIDGWACALALRTLQARHQIPTGWNKIAHCKHCGDVWAEHQLTTLSCSWCWMRNEGMTFPQPEVQT